MDIIPLTKELATKTMEGGRQELMGKGGKDIISRIGAGRGDSGKKKKGVMFAWIRLHNRNFSCLLIESRFLLFHSSPSAITLMSINVH